MSHAWTIEQYGLVGFSGMYANKLHVPRVCHARQIMLWLLECAPGLPTDMPLVLGDLGAGTCAACLGARVALKELAGDEQPFRAFPIDVASSSARFASAFRAMTRNQMYGRPALLPGQEADQYLTEEQPGVYELAASLFAQLTVRGVRHPHVLLASFSLHYLPKNERDAFFAALPAAVAAPLLLVIIKGVGETQRPSPEVVRSVYLGLHYVIGQERHPRIVEAHVCLILPATMEGGGSGGDGGGGGVAGGGVGPSLPPPQIHPDMSPSDRWVVQTFLTMQRRCRRRGLRTSATVLRDGIP